LSPEYSREDEDGEHTMLVVRRLPYSVIEERPLKPYGGWVGGTRIVTPDEDTLDVIRDFQWRMDLLGLSVRGLDTRW
jgi:hypothetical protein